jgi:hypothetical protein
MSLMILPRGAGRLKCPKTFLRLLAMAHLELRLFSIQAALVREAAALVSHIRSKRH